MLITERMNRVISGHQEITSKEELLMFWEHYYINLNEDARIAEYEKLKNEYFRIADEYEQLLKSNPGAIDNELLNKKYTIRQRKVGIRMIASAQGTEFESEAKTFEAQTANTPAGDRSATNIRFLTQYETRAKESSPWGTSPYSPPIQTFSDFLKVFLSNKAIQKRLIGRILFYLFLELLGILFRIYQVKQLASKAVKDDYWSDLIGNIIGKNVSVKIIKSPMYTVFGCSGSIVITSKIIEKLDEEEVIALSLFSYGVMLHSLARGFGFGTLRFILVTSIEMAFTYSAVIKVGKPGEHDTSDIIRRINIYRSISELVLQSLFIFLNFKLEVSSALKYVKRKGYLRQLMDVRKKIPKDRAKSIPNVDVETARVTADLFTKFLGLINFKKSMEKDNISKPVSALQKAVSIFKRFK